MQLLPVEPTTVYETGPEFWVEADDAHSPSVAIELRRPDTTNWGYDVVILGSAAVSPTLLESGRPDELADLASTLHSFPGRPIRLILDVVYGHSDNQGLACLPHQFFAGPNMYGQNLDYQNPWVRASLLEMQRRKVNFGADGVRIDGAQDFKWWDADAHVLRHDDAYLQSMSDIVQEVAGCRYRPWMIFEDGRPWPQEDWELSSTYRAVIEQQTDDDVFQWGPLTFAHNTPFIYGFWLARWWRIRQMLEVGENWISGCANHDTLRRGTQVSPKLNINTRLGATRMEILDKAYDNPAVDLLTYAAFPGVPMDFLNAAMRASWGFIRNQDDRYGVKVVAEEAVSLDWQVDEETYEKPAHFQRLKALGFAELDELRRFMRLLPALVEATDYDLDAIAHAAPRLRPAARRSAAARRRWPRRSSPRHGWTTCTTTAMSTATPSGCHRRWSASTASSAASAPSGPGCAAISALTTGSATATPSPATRCSAGTGSALTAARPSSASSTSKVPPSASTQLATPPCRPATGRWHCALHRSAATI